jgi:purine-nucleoside phosphorylase
MIDSDAVVIEPRRGSKDKAAAQLALLACTEIDRRRFYRMTGPAAGCDQTIYNARLRDVIYGNRRLTLAGPILGAPQAVLVVEKLIALGSRTIVVFGWCGSLQPDVRIGDWLLPSWAHSEEGTSRHYPLDSGEFIADGELLTCLQDHCLRDGYFVRPGPVWTTDAPLRETANKVTTYGKKGLLAVEMEMSALFRVAAYRKVRLVGLLVVSDELFTLKWRPGLQSTHFKRSCNRACKTLLDFCASIPPDLLS